MNQKLTKSKLKKEIHRIQELREDHETRYFMGYEDALRWVAQRIEVQSGGRCKVPVEQCATIHLGGMCREHFKCKDCGEYHQR